MCQHLNIAQDTKTQNAEHIFQDSIYNRLLNGFTRYTNTGDHSIVFCLNWKCHYIRRMIHSHF